MIKRYHKEVGFDKEHTQQLIDLVISFNETKKYGRTKHAFHRLNERFDYINILNYLANKVEFNFSQIFEYYTDGEAVCKVCFRITYKTSEDLIIVLTNKKDIVTLYVNAVGDNHKTLKTELYEKVGG